MRLRAQPLRWEGEEDLAEETKKDEAEEKWQRSR